MEKLICNTCLNEIHEGELYVENILGDIICYECLKDELKTHEKFDRTDVD